MPDRILQVLCSQCKARNEATFNFCQHCGTPPFRGLLAPRASGIAVVIDDDLLQARKATVLASMNGKAGQQRKCAVADKFDAFLRERSKGLRGWENATDDDVLEWLC